MIKYRINKDGSYQIITNNQYTEDGKIFTILKDSTDEMLEEIGIFDVQRNELLEGYTYSGKFELFDGILYETQIEIPKPSEIDEKIMNEMLFNAIQAKKEMEQLFEDSPKAIQLFQFHYTINQNIDSRNFKRLNIISQGLFLSGIVTETELGLFRNIFLSQKIDITTY